MKLIPPHSLTLLLLAVLAPSPGRAVEWQWSVEMPGIVAPETARPPRAFLWIPPNCGHVRGVVVGQHNLQEGPILEHPIFRAALRELGFAAVWITPPFDPIFRFDQGAGERFDAVMAALAAESGYRELAHAPLVPLGHGAGASFPWNFAAWNPTRTLAAISLSGQWPYHDNDDAMPAWGDRTLDGVPGLVTLGEYEWADERIPAGLALREQYPKLPLSMLAEAGGGHFEVSEEKVAYLALYLRKAAQARLPAEPPRDAPIVLTPIDPAATGWLVDRWRFDEPPRVPTAPVDDYAEPEEAFWFFDEELATATEKFRANQRGKKAALLGYVQNGVVLPQNSGTHQQVTIPFSPIHDGLTFKLTGTFIDRVPEGRPERWTGRKAGSAIGRPIGGGPIIIEPICGPVEKVSADTFAIRFDRVGLHDRSRASEIWFAAIHPGDAQFKRSVQQAVLHFPPHNTGGADQRITFAEIPPQRVGTKSIPLSASSSATGAKVRFYVREGPAEVVGDTLVFTPLPPRAKFPVKVTVVAWQWGRSIEPRLETAEPVERTVLLLP